jgi:hypothetical protein
MYSIINNGNTSEISEKSKDYTLIDLLPTKNDDTNMKSELKNFLKSQLHN